MIRACLKSFFQKYWPEAVIFLAWLTAALLLIAYHELWFDEAQAFLIARDNDLSGIIRLMGYEGTPALWHFILFILIQLFHLPFAAISYVNLFFASISVILILFASPFSRAQKFLIPFGYFFLFEYGVLARSYGLSMTLIIALSALYRHRRDFPIWYFILLFFLANTNIHSLIIAMALMADFAIDIARKNIAANRRTIAALLIGAAAIVAVYVQVRPPHDAGAALIPSEVSQPYISITDAFLPIPEIKRQFWNSQSVMNYALNLPKSLVPHYFALSATSSLIGIILLGLTAYWLWPHKKFLWLYVAVFAGLSFIFLVVHPGYFRHHGFLWIFFIFCLWIRHRDISPDTAARADRIWTWSFTTILLVQVLSAGIAGYFEIRYPFSDAAVVARYLDQNGYYSPDQLLVAFHSSVASSILAHYDSPKDIYCYDIDRFCTFTIHNHNLTMNYREAVYPKKVIAKFTKISREFPNNKIVVISSVTLSNKEYKKYFHLRISFPFAIERDNSNLKIYEFIPNPK